MNQDTISFHELYNKYAKDVYRFSFWLTGDSDEANDVTSETFVRIWTSTTRIQLESVKAYLFTIARNLHLQTKRRKKKQTPLVQEYQDPALQPDKAFEVQSELDDALKALQTLPEIDRTVMLMKIEEDLSYEDIAGAVGLTVAAVKVKIFRARAKINSLTHHSSKEKNS